VHAAAVRRRSAPCSSRGGHAFARTRAWVRILASAGLSARKTHVGAELGDINLVVRLIIVVLRSDVAATITLHRPKALGKRQGRVYV
jgi:hypothetical protein